MVGTWRMTLLLPWILYDILRTSAFKWWSECFEMYADHLSMP